MKKLSLLKLNSTETGLEIQTFPTITKAKNEKDHKIKETISNSSLLESYKDINYGIQDKLKEISSRFWI